MSTSWKSPKHERLAGSLLVVALALLTLALFAIAWISTPRVDAATRDGYRHRDDDRDRRAGEPFHWRGRLARGQTLEVRGINGSIRAVRAEGGDAEVDAEKSGRKSDPDDVKIDVIETREGVTICARYPKRNGELNDCENQRLDNNDVNVSYTVRVPAGVPLTTRTVNGRVEIDELGSDVDAATVNGSIDLATSGVANASTVNGSIHARIGRGDWGEGLRFQTVNGSIHLVLPPDVDADVKASTLNGSVSSDLPIRILGRLSSHRLSGTIGEGGPRLRLGTVNGGIELRTDERGRRTY